MSVNQDSKEVACRTCVLRSKSYFADLNEDELRVIEQDKKVASFKPGEVIYAAGNYPSGLLCLKSGKVKITKKDDLGSEQIIDLRKPVDFISLKSLMAENYYSCSAIALEESEVCIIQKENFNKILLNNPAFSMKMIQFFANKLEENEQRTLVLTTKHMRARLAKALLFAYETYGLDTENVINVKLKRSELAALTNMIPSNATRTLSEFVKENIVATNKRKISIINLQHLKEISQYGYIQKPSEEF